MIMLNQWEAIQICVEPFHGISWEKAWLISKLYVLRKKFLILGCDAFKQVISPSELMKFSRCGQLFAPQMLLNFISMG